jgi:acetyl-CoA acyltransferase
VPEVVIVEAVRTAIGKRNGSLAGMHSVDLSAEVLNALVQRAGIEPDLIDDVVWGCVSQVGDQSSNIGRYAVLAAGWPESIPGTSVNRACGSSQQALEFAIAGVASGFYDVAVAGGVENMSRVGINAAKEGGQAYGPRAIARYNGVRFNQGIGAELIAEQWGLSRTQLDEFAVQSHELAAAAIDAGRFADQIHPISTGPGWSCGAVGEGMFDTDEGVRRGSTVEKLASLKTSFQEDGVIHAGNSSQISDGAAALLIMTAERARELGLKPIVRYIAGAVVGDDPIKMLTGPIPATAAVLKRAGLSIDDIDAFEVNEAFASVNLAWLKETGADPARMNPLGGAIAVGHPLGGSGAILMTRLINHLRDTGKRYGLQTMCEGGGTANATIVELVA